MPSVVVTQQASPQVQQMYGTPSFSLNLEGCDSLLNTAGSDLLLVPGVAPTAELVPDHVDNTPAANSLPRPHPMAAIKQEATPAALPQQGPAHATPGATPRVKAEDEKVGGSPRDSSDDMSALWLDTGDDFLAGEVSPFYPTLDLFSQEPKTDLL